MWLLARVEVAAGVGEEGRGHRPWWGVSRSSSKEFGVLPNCEIGVGISVYK